MKVHELASYAGVGLPVFEMPCMCRAPQTDSRQVTKNSRVL